jgi:hypothetical protein
MNMREGFSNRARASESLNQEMLYNSTKLLGDEVTGVRVGGTIFSRGSAHFDQLYSYAPW